MENSGIKKICAMVESECKKIRIELALNSSQHVELVETIPAEFALFVKETFGFSDMHFTFCRRGSSKERPSMIYRLRHPNALECANTLGGQIADPSLVVTRYQNLHYALDGAKLMVYIPAVRILPKADPTIRLRSTQNFPNSVTSALMFSADIEAPLGQQLAVSFNHEEDANPLLVQSFIVDLTIEQQESIVLAPYITPLHHERFLEIFRDKKTYVDCGTQAEAIHDVIRNMHSREVPASLENTATGSVPERTDDFVRVDSPVVIRPIRKKGHGLWDDV